MERITVTGFRWVPTFAQGLARDMRVRWALQEAGRAYDVDLIDLGERHSESYRRRHPFGLIPAFEADGHGVFESGAILHRIAEVSPELMPTDAVGRANTLAWMFAALNTVEPPLDALSVLDLQHPGEEWAKLRRPGAVEAVQVRLDALAAWLEPRDFLLGRFTAADILMTTVLRLIRHTDLVTRIPVLEVYQTRCEARPAFQRALAEQMDGYRQNAPMAA
ncbi:glutathione S-transferase family protein [Aurantimonas sp. MSK8Z-1]|uniref:glutathione S-transferase family protein n=1 Tax=Mangrovibrevibacter kandeliae TaxID=2968473 RepID=UPI00211827DF|nr:glutathione S-transferase family protein [Aurantimonas sp. MSK8Z-1]MCW4113648.1 glutathione S-transferase family protein [Aurantimonas sp. MSK8Z-1]